MKQFLALLLAPFLALAKPTGEYFPQQAMNPVLPTPESVLGFGIGDWHLRFDQQQQYLAALADRSERIQALAIGRTTEQRRQVLLAISSPANLARLEAIRQAHLKVTTGKRDSALPAVVWLGYSVHGDEPSGANAAPLLAYWLAASNSPQVRQILEHTIVFIDPALNPDGLDRYANFANNMAAQQPSDSLQHRSRWQDFPAGRLSHYGFDLNRDWLLLTHPASQNRIRFWQQWLPQVFGDFHEMGPHSTFFMQPGVASRVNPLTPKENQAITRALAADVAKGLDQQGRLYFTGESFDDFYWGKASSYGDAMGAIGILYEQARVRGQVQATPFGRKTFTFSIENQLLASQQLLSGVVRNKARLAQYQNDFFRSAVADAKRNKLRGYLLKDPGDPARLSALALLLRRHGIQVQRLQAPVKLAGNVITKGLFVPLAQPQARLVQSVFSTPTTFSDNTFYDVSAWNLPAAFNIEALPVSRRQYQSAMSGPDWQVQPASLPAVTAVYAWTISWQDSRAPALLADLLRTGVRVFALGRVAHNGEQLLQAGDLLIPRRQPGGDVLALLQQLSQRHQLAIRPLASGLSQQGVDLGSPSLLPLRAPRVGLLVGRDIHAQRAGGVWHSLDTRAGVAVSLLDSSVLPWLDLREFTHLIVPAAAPLALNSEQSARIKQWVEQGGRLILMTDAVAWGAQQGLLAVKLKDEQARLAQFASADLRYADQDAHLARTLIAGTQVLAQLDNSHPLNFGLVRPVLALMRDHTVMVAESEQPFSVLARYQHEPLLAGYMSEPNRRALAGTPAAIAQHLGQGSVVALLDDVSFRGIQRGSERWLTNALYLPF